jgi:aspartate kinase
MNIVKFGGKSLANGEGLKSVIAIILDKLAQKEVFIVVLSARGNTTDELDAILNKAKLGQLYEADFDALKSYQQKASKSLDFNHEFQHLDQIFRGVALLGEISEKQRDLVLAFGELFAVKTVCHLLQEKGVNAEAIDSRNFLLTDTNFGNAKIKDAESAHRCKTIFKQLEKGVLPIVTGFIAATEDGQTTTLGRNGSTYSAALIANYLDAQELQNYTHVSGMFTADPHLVDDAKIINHLSYQEANELANFGATILHTRSIYPLVEKEIVLRIKNTFNLEQSGTTISAEQKDSGIKAIAVQEKVSLIHVEGKDLLGRTGIDARIFTTIKNQHISIGLISQGSSERGVGFIVPKDSATRAISALEHEFEQELRDQSVNRFEAIDDIIVITLIGQNLNDFTHSFQSLIQNQVQIKLISNTLSGKNISLVVRRSDKTKAVNVIHSQIFGVSKKINIAIFGKGNVGASLIDQILKSQDAIERRKEIRLHIFAIASSKKLLLNKQGIEGNWRETFAEADDNGYDINTLISYAKANHLENLVAIDNTASAEFIHNYSTLVEKGFDLISSNKIANTVGFDFYKALRYTLKKHKKTYFYETNVGAGLPLIDTIRVLHESGENIVRIRGVFSGSLSFLFNKFSTENLPFHSVLNEAIEGGLTEPDPREDLSGNDVARKLLILARELDLENEFSDINVENLIPDEFNNFSAKAFIERAAELDDHFATRKREQNANHVLRYVGDLHGDLFAKKGTLDVRLVSVPKSSSLGQLSGADSIFEIYTESYGEKPIVIQGAGAGAAVTARGVFGDLLRKAELS